jgi:rhodanese-related sulfurtransferase
MQEVDINQLAPRVADKATVLDVREQGEYRQGHLPGAVNIPMGQLPARFGELDRAQPVYVVCASGNRSSAMTEVLTAAGFDAVNVAGGTNAWIRSGRPVER